MTPVRLRAGCAVSGYPKLYLPVGVVGGIARTRDSR